MSPNNDRRPSQPASASGNTPGPTPIPAAPARPAALPSFRVLLHNDDDLEAMSVVKALLEATPLDPASAKGVMWSAHTKGIALVLTTHQERAELYQELLCSKGLTVSIERA